MKSKLLRAENLIWLLIALSAVLYGLDYLMVGNLRDIETSFLGNLAFLPIYVLFVTLMIEKILRERERVAIRQKLNMVIGTFFSEIGNPLLRDVCTFLTGTEQLAERLHVTGAWKDADYDRAAEFLRAHEVKVDSRQGDLEELRRFLTEKRPFMLVLMENPNLLEHDEFTDLLWSVFHLIEELEARGDFAALPSSDLDHLSGDLKRVYTYLTREWLAYMRHLQRDYPYLFSLAVRLNPLNPAAHAEVY